MLPSSGSLCHAWRRHTTCPRGNHEMMLGPVRVSARRGMRAAVVLTVAPAVLVLAFGCVPDEETEIPDQEPEWVEETVVIPGGSHVTTRYWVSAGFSWDRVEKSDMPQESRVTHITTVLGSPQSTFPQVAAGRSTSITGADAQAAPNEVVVAFFAGGRAPPALVSARAALYYAGQPMITGLSLLTARNGHAMAVLPGERVLVVGGYGAGLPAPLLASSEIFTLASRTFAVTGSLALARSAHTATPLPDGRVLVAGGSVAESAGFTTATTEIFNPGTGSFSAGPSMTMPRFNHSAIPLDDGRVLVLGGNGLRSAEVYSPTTNTFSPVGNMAVNHGLGHVAVKLGDGRVLVLGGDATLNIQPSAAAELFDPATNSFTSAGNMSMPRMQHFAVLEADGRVLIGGGRTTGGDSVLTAEIYDPMSNSFTPIADLPLDTYDSPAAHVSGPRTP